MEILIPFLRKYICEKTFTSIKIIKTRYRYQLETIRTVGIAEISYETKSSQTYTEKSGTNVTSKMLNI